MNEPKRHHFVPRFYLSNFADGKGMIWVFDRKTKEYHQQNIRDTAVQRHYYRVKLKTGEYSTEVEKLLSAVEAKACLAMNKLTKNEHLSEEERSNIAIFMGFQKTRVPDFEKSTNEAQEKLFKEISKRSFCSVEATKDILEGLNKNETEGKEKSVTPEEMHKFIQEEEYTIKFPRERTIKTMLKIAVHLAEYFVEMDWLIVCAPKKTTFITTDNPFTLFPPPDHNSNSFWGGVGIITKGAKKAFPISPNTSLFIGDMGNQFTQTTISCDKARAINIFYARTSDRFMYSRDEKLLRSVVKKSKVEEIPLDRERVSVS
ncbi:DUF4238 domain-containing protein [Candidatus Parcubacteria bacterium]|nr:DUF4238 domain-containing protein [Candidatus Parcubacteria bacterium]